MDFTTTEAAQDLGGLVDTIVDAVCTPEHQRELDKLEQRFDRELWRKLIDAGILSSAAPESLGGDGFGVLEQVAVLVALGHQLAAVPYLESVVLAAGALARFGSPELQQGWGVSAVSGDRILTVALDGEMGEGPVQAAGTGHGYRLTGTRTQVGYGPVADAFLVPAETDSGAAVFLVAAGDPGVAVTALATTGLGSVGHLELNGAKVDAARRVGGTDVAVWLGTLSTLSRTAFQLGVLERGLQMTAEYARTREQFDRPIGSFQAVGQRLADGYIDVKGLRLTLTQAAWRVAEDSLASRECPQPADIDVATAGFWAAEAGHRVAHTIVHVHGGVGVDTDHPVHRYFLAAKQTEFALGGATGQLRRIGRELAETPAKPCLARRRCGPRSGPRRSGRIEPTDDSHSPDRHRTSAAAIRNRRSGRLFRGLVHQLARPHPARCRNRRSAAGTPGPGAAATRRCVTAEHAVLLGDTGGRRAVGDRPGGPQPGAPRRGTGRRHR